MHDGPMLFISCLSSRLIGQGRRRSKAPSADKAGDLGRLGGWERITILTFPGTLRSLVLVSSTPTSLFFNIFMHFRVMWSVEHLFWRREFHTWSEQVIINDRSFRLAFPTTYFLSISDSRGPSPSFARHGAFRCRFWPLQTRTRWARGVGQTAPARSRFHNKSNKSRFIFFPPPSSRFLICTGVSTLESCPTGRCQEIVRTRPIIMKAKGSSEERVLLIVIDERASLLAIVPRR